MKKEILEILKSLESKVDGIEMKLERVVDQTADLVDFRSEMVFGLMSISCTQKVQTGE
ncbi:MAG: hypothetical protein NSGCLCUN01_02675 [uncultured Clostridium sp.]